MAVDWPYWRIFLYVLLTFWLAGLIVVGGFLMSEMVIGTKVTMCPMALPGSDCGSRNDYSAMDVIKFFYDINAPLFWPLFWLWGNLFVFGAYVIYMPVLTRFICGNVKRFSSVIWAAIGTIIINIAVVSFEYWLLYTERMIEPKKFFVFICLVNFVFLSAALLLQFLFVWPLLRSRNEVASGPNISGMRHFALMLCASFLALFLFGMGMGLPLMLNPMLYVIAFLAIGFAHCLTPLLLFVYYPLTLKYWQNGQRDWATFCGTGLWVAALNGFALGLLIQGGQGIMGTDPFEVVEVFRFVPIYIICGLMTGALHWLFLTSAQRKLDKQIADDLS